MSTSQVTALRCKDTASAGDLYMSFELGDKHWHINIGGDRRSVSHYIVEAGHTEEVADCIAKAAARLHAARVHSCYEPAVTAISPSSFQSSCGTTKLMIFGVAARCGGSSRRAVLK